MTTCEIEYPAQTLPDLMAVLTDGNTGKSSECEIESIPFTDRYTVVLGVLKIATFNYHPAQGIFNIEVSRWIKDNPTLHFGIGLRSLIKTSHRNKPRMAA